jgi:FixJ family two-component response regulator
MLDTDMPGLSGLDILKKIDARNYRAPVFVVSEREDVPIVVEAIKNGAFDFIVKQFDAENVVSRVREAIETGAGRGVLNAVVDSSRKSPGYEKLTGREREVLAQIASGASNKEVGRLLGISPRTVEVHRARVMEKLGVRSAAQLMHIVLSA